MSRGRASRLFGGAVVALAVALSPAPALAHLNSTGMGPIYDGAMHFFTSPEDLLPVIALALFTGLRGAAYGRGALFVLPAAWLVGGLIGLPAPAASGSALLSACWFLLFGGLLAADLGLSLPVVTVLAALLGFSHGYLNGTGLGLTTSAAAALIGLACVVFVLVALAAALVTQLRAQWARIAVRVAGSWIAASGLLLLGWAARRG